MRNIYRSLVLRERAFVWVAVMAALVALTAWVFSRAGVAAAAQVAAAVGTLITALLILAQLREMQEARLAQERPQVIVDLENRTSPFVYVVVRNIGKGPATDISFDFSAPIEIPEGRRNSGLVPVSEQPYFRRGLPYLAPGAEISTFWGSMPTLAPFLREEGLHDGITVTSHYRSVAGEAIETQWVLNPLLMADTLSLGIETLEDHVQRLSEAAETIAKNTGESLKIRKKELTTLTELKSIHRQLYRPMDELERSQAERSAVDQQIRNRIIMAICEEWKTTEGYLHSKTVYERLVRDGEEPPAGAMKDLLEELKDQLLISGSLRLGRDEIARHGNMRITDVDPELCEAE